MIKTDQTDNQIRPSTGSCMNCANSTLAYSLQALMIKNDKKLDEALRDVWICLKNSCKFEMF